MYYRQQQGQGMFFPPLFPGGDVNRRLERMERQIQRLDNRVNRLERRMERVERRLGMFGQY